MNCSAIFRRMEGTAGHCVQRNKTDTERDNCRMFLLEDGSQTFKGRWPQSSLRTAGREGEEMRDDQNGERQGWV